MKRIRVITLFLIFLCCLCSCVFVQEKGTFIERKDEINKVEIVEYCEYDSEKEEFVLETLLEISNVEAFVEQLSECIEGTNYGEPSVLKEGSIVVKITYSDGEYHLIDSYAQLKVKSDRANSGYIIFNKDKFEDLLDSYIGDTADGSVSS